jgi:MinD-like ATPase involved in chromosome partitioning or flagellar assembly
MRINRCTILAGHYGSGKTACALTLACRAAQNDPRSVVLCDLDTVNPYFRTADFKETLLRRGVSLLSSPYANSNVEATWLPPGLEATLNDPNLITVLDVGGDAAGAAVLGRFAPTLAQIYGEISLLMVVNMLRPLSRDTQSLLALKREMEAAAGLPFTGIIHNSNLARHSTAETLQATVPALRDFARCAGLPVSYTAYAQALRGVVFAPEDGEPLPVAQEFLEKPGWGIYARTAG